MHHKHKHGCLNPYGRDFDERAEKMTKGSLELSKLKTNNYLAEKRR